jgi:NAD(P)-dependent dehydrogenase (short-subunit alcohol dehydrogenase family)
MADAAIVAGGAGALGSVVVRELRDSGWAVTVLDRHGQPVDAIDGVGYVQADLLDPASAASAVSSIDGLKAVVNLVGGYKGGSKVGDADLADFESMLRLNLVPAFNLATAAVPQLAESGGGAFVCVSAKAALHPFSGAAGYITAKAGLIAFVRALDAEHRDSGIRANAVLPSVIDTPANRDQSPDADWSKWVSPAEIAKVIRFLCSDDSAPTSGAAIPVYGSA